MDLQKIEDEALHLPKEERVKLIQRLVLSLESPSEEELRSGVGRLLRIEGSTGGWCLDRGI